MFLNLIAAAQIGIAQPAIDNDIWLKPIAIHVPYLSPIVGPSVNAGTLAPIVNCDRIVVNKQTPFDIITACATGRVGWLKL